MLGGKKIVFGGKKSGRFMNRNLKNSKVIPLNQRL